MRQSQLATLKVNNSCGVLRYSANQKLHSSAYQNQAPGAIPECFTYLISSIAAITGFGLKMHIIVEPHLQACKRNVLVILESRFPPDPYRWRRVRGPGIIEQGFQPDTGNCPERSKDPPFRKLRICISSKHQVLSQCQVLSAIYSIPSWVSATCKPVLYRVLKPLPQA